MPPLTRGFVLKGWDTTAVAPLASAIDRLERSAAAFAEARDRALASGVSFPSQVATNATLLKVERAFARPSGLNGRPWYRSLIYVADIDNGYANMNFPGVNEAVRAGDRALAFSELADLAQRFGVAADLMDEAARLVGTPQ